MYMLPGAWVYINDGLSLHRREADTKYDYSAAYIGFRRRMLKFKEDDKIEVSYGFFVGDADNAERVNVFSMKRMKKEYLHKDDVRAVEMTTAAKFDADPDLRRLNQAYFAEYGVVDDKIYTGVNTDPGAEVVYNGELWNIVRFIGDRATIEDEIGNRKMVSLDKLDPGRSRHSNSWNYGRTDKVFNNDFGAASEAQVFAGMFCWMPSRPIFRDISDWEMACVRNIAPDGYHCCVFIDGEYIVCPCICPG